MEWILRNLEMILIIAGPIAIWLNQRAKEKRGEPADYDGDGRPEAQPARPAPPPSDGARRAQAQRQQERLDRQLHDRRIVEEAAARSAARKKATRAEQLERTRWEEPPPLDEAVLAAQSTWEEQPLKLAERRAQGEGPPLLSVPTQRSASPRRPANRNPANLLKELRDPESMRRAIVIREVLGPPVALR